jgi:hypothetical protein
MAALLAIWAALRSFDEDQVPAFERKASPILDALQSASAAVTVGYLANLAGERPNLRDFVLDQDLRGPFIGVWAELKRTGNRTDAEAVGANRAQKLASERVIETQREGMRRTTKVVGFRRVPQGATCSWCVHVATQRYHTADSASFGHGHKGVNYCDCDIVPIVGHSDPGQVINGRILEQWKAAQQQDAPPAYFDTDGRTLAPAERPS